MSLIIAATAVLALLFAGYSARKVTAYSTGTPKMEEIAEAIHQGAMAFMHREFQYLAVFLVILAVVLGYFIHPFVALSYLIGSVASSIAGYVGMKIATKANVRTAQASISSFGDALDVAFSGGAVMGFTVVGVGLLGLLAIFLPFLNVEHTLLVEIMLAYGFGASSIALFLRVGGGIFTKSADVGADLVGKVEKGIPEDDPRNPATIADNVGDNVGDIAGMGSDLFESYVSSILAAMILGFIVFGMNGMMLPLFISAAGIVASIIGAFFVRSRETSKDFTAQTTAAAKALGKGTIVSMLITIALSYFVIAWVLNDYAPLQFTAAYLSIGHGVFFATITGLVSGFIIGRSTEYYTSDKNKPVRGIANSSLTGAATNIIEGFSVGLMSTWIPVVVVSAAILVAYLLAGLFGISIAAVGMLATLGMLMSIDSYGPVVDNAAGIAEMSGLGKDVRERCEALDAVGNTTAAVGKGFAISSAALSALAWVAVYFEVVHLDVVSLTEPTVLVGLFLGSMMPFVFSALTMRAVSEGANSIVNEVRRQFREIKGIMTGKAKADHERCIEIATTQALKSMLLPGILVITVPIAVGLLLGVAALGGFLVGVLSTGFLVAIMMANSGGAWDNAKKYIESGALGGKGSDAHKAAVVGDTVGDPFKDTSGPSLNILIKLIGKVALIFAPLFLMYALM